MSNRINLYRRELRKDYYAETPRNPFDTALLAVLEYYQHSDAPNYFNRVKEKIEVLSQTKRISLASPLWELYVDNKAEIHSPTTYRPDLRDAIHTLINKFGVTMRKVYDFTEIVKLVDSKGFKIIPSDKLKAGMITPAYKLLVTCSEYDEPVWEIYNLITNRFEDVVMASEILICKTNIHFAIASPNYVQLINLSCPPTMSINRQPWGLEWRYKTGRRFQMGLFVQ